MQVGDKYKVKIIDEDNIGNGIARIDNLVIFIKNALIDEELEVEITNINKKYLNGIITNIIKSSFERKEPLCKYYEECGGCNFLHTSFDNEINIKTKYLNKLFNREINYIKVNNEYNYRNKVVLHILEGKIGLYNDKTHTLCNLDSCMLLNQKINSKISDLNNYNLNGINEITIRCINNKIMLNILGKPNKELNNIECDSLYINDKYIKGDKYLIDEINNLKFSIYPNAFYQVNNEGMEAIYNKVKEYAGTGNKLLDLYCGTGTIGIWLHDNYKDITGIEINKSSIDNANLNKELNNLKNIKFICGDSKIAKGNYDTIIVDPPRSGLSKDVINFLDNSNSKKIVYVSCNPNTLKRDIDLLHNYELKELSCTSMFPRTKHIEAISLLEHK